jgi:hypothetical protein
MKASVRAAIMLVIAGFVGAAAAAPPAGGPVPPGLGFLEAGKDYVIRLPETHDVFKITSAGVSQSTYTTVDGQSGTMPVPWRSTMTVHIFHVVRFGAGSWVLVKYPANPNDYLSWAFQRQAMAVLAGPGANAIGAKPDGPARLKKLREQASAVIATAETWLNLDHAIAIAAVPAEEPELKLRADGATITPSP